MKIIICTFIIFALSGFVSNATGQGSRQYNSVELFSSCQIVPPGTFWKVKIFLSNLPDTCNIGISGTKILVNGMSVMLIYHSGMRAGSNAFYHSMLPVWQPEGTSLSHSTGADLLSVTKFNV